MHDKIFDYRHRNTASMFTAELQAISQCLTSSLSLPASYSNSALIISESLSALTAISNPHSSHPLVTQIFTLLTTFNSSTLTVSFMWVPSHCGTPGNEKVDAAAKAAANHSRINPHILPTESDFHLFTRRIIHHHWSKLWQNQIPFSNKLAQLKNSTTAWPSPLQN